MHTTPRWLAAWAFWLAVTAWLTPIALGQGPELFREAISPEYSVFVGSDSAVLAKEVLTREVSLFVGQESSDGFREIVARETSIVVTTPEVPAKVVELLISVSPTGDEVHLDWSRYSEILQRDVVRFEIYVSDKPFANIQGRSPYAVVAAETKSLVVRNLTPWEDHYFVVVAVDALEQFNPEFEYSAAYVIAPEIVAREISIHVGGAELSEYKETITREISVVVSDPAYPAKVEDLRVAVSPTGSEATLLWSTYNEWIQHDLLRYRLYVSSTPFTSVLGMTPYQILPVGVLQWTVQGLTEYEDHYFAVVAEDPNGFNTDVVYSAGYVVAPEVITREISILALSDEIQPFKEVVTREVSLLVPDEAVPAPVTGISSSFDAFTSRLLFSAIDIDWSGYNESIQRDVLRYRIYLGPTFFEDVTGWTPVEYVPAGILRYTLGGLRGGDIYYVAVVAEDALGNFDTRVRPRSVKASIGALGEVKDLRVTSFGDKLEIDWTEPEQVDAFLAKHHVYFNGSSVPIVLQASALGYDFEGLQEATSYSFRVSTVDMFGTESAGVEGIGVTWLPNPSGLVAEGLDGRVRLKWRHAEPNNFVKHYAVYASEADFSSVMGMTPVLTTRETWADITGLANGIQRFFAVTTVNISDGENPSVLAANTTPNPVFGSFADLAVSGVTSPSAAFQGQSVNIGWVVSNGGAAGTSTRNGTPVAAWKDRIVLSPDSVLGDADDVILAEVPRIGTLAAQASYKGSATVQIPANLLGRHYLFLLIDALDEVFENLDTGANVSGAAQTLTITPAVPDLFARELTATASESVLSVEWKTRNQGSASTTGPWHETISVSPNPDGAGAQVLATQDVSGPIGIGGELTRSATFAAPNLQGTYYVIVQVDSQNEITETSGEDNNRTIVAVQRVQCVETPAGLVGWWRGDGNAADELGRQNGLMLGGVTFQAGVVGDGFHFDGVDDSVSVAAFPNLGMTNVSVSFWYKSAVNSLGRWMKLVNKGCSNSGSPQNAGYMVRLELGELAFSVHDENGITLRVAVPEPAEGTWHHVAGVLDRESKSIRLYLNGNAVADSGYGAFGSLDTNLRLAFGALDRTGGGPSEAITEHFFGQMDEVAIFDQAITSSQVNQIYSSRIAGMCANPDLQIVGASVSTPVLAGGRTSLTWQTANKGTAPVVSSWKESIFLAADANGATAQHLYTVTRSGPLNAGTEVEMTQSATILSSLAPGTYYVIIRTDAENQVAEGNDEGNNSFTLAVQVGTQDLAVQNFSATATTMGFGGSLPVSWGTRNLGSVAIGSDWVDRVYLSVSPDSIAGAALLATQNHENGLASGGDYSRALTLALPPYVNQTLGTYYLILLSDADGAVTEPNEGNNRAVVQLTMTAPPVPDLVVQNLMVAQVGSALRIRWLTKNQGTAVVAGHWNERISLSPSPDGANPQTVATQSQSGPLAAGGELVGTFDYPLPANTTGTWYVVVEVDSDGDIAEREGEANNRTISAAAVIRCAAVADGLVAWLPGDGNAQDLVTGNGGNLLGGVGFVSAVRNQGFTFDDIDDAVEVPNTGGRFNLTEAWTIMAWAKPRSSGADGRNDPIIYKNARSDRNQDTFALTWTSGNRFAAGLEEASPNVDGRNFAVASSPHTPGQFYFVVGRYDGNELAVYVNGVKEGATVIGRIVAYTGAEALRIGSMLNSTHGNRGVFDGVVDEVHIFNRALSDSEVQKLFHAGYSDLCVCTGDPLLSDFSASAEEWMMAEFRNPSSDDFAVTTDNVATEWNAAGGNPGGFVRGVDPESNYFYLKAPAKFLGNRGAAYGGLLAFDYAHDLDGENFGANIGPDIVLKGGGLWLTAEIGLRPLSSWKRYSIPLLEGQGWRKGVNGAAPSKVEFLEVLSRLEGVWVMGDLISGNDRASLDNFSFGTPIISDQPEDQMIAVDTELLLKVGSSGAFTFQWFFNGEPILNATDATLRIEHITPDKEGAYHAVVTGCFGSTSSRMAQITVRRDAPNLAVSNLSIEPSSPFAGGFATLRFQGENRGTAEACCQWNYAVRIENLDNGAVAYDGEVVTGTEPLLVGETDPRELTFSLPSGAAGVGRWRARVTVDARGQVDEYSPSLDAEADNVGAFEFISTLPPSPDLRVRTVLVSAVESLPGEKVELSWTVENAGNAPAHGPWTETIYVSADGAIGGDIVAGTVTFEGTLSSNESVQRTSEVTIPFNGPAGNLYFVVATDSNTKVSEQNENNNGGISEISISVPTILKLAIPVAQIAENAASPVVQAVVSRSGPVVGSVTVNALSSDATEATVPVTVTLLSGQSSAVLPISVQKDGVVDGPQSVSFSVSAAGFQSAVGGLTVIDSDLPKLALTLASTIVEGHTANGTATRDTVTDRPLTVLLASSTPAELHVPASVTIPANEASVAFTATALPDDQVETDRAHTVTATATGHATAQTSVTIPANDFPSITLELSDYTISEGVGPQAAVLKISRQGTSSLPLNLELRSLDVSAVTMPPTAVILAGRDSVSVYLAPVDDDFVDGAQVATLNVYALASGGARVSAAEAMVEVTDDDGPTLKLTVTPKVVGEGILGAAVATVSRNTNPGVDLEVELTVDKPGEASMPAKVTIPAGSTSVQFNLDTLADGNIDGSQTVVMTAAAEGFVSGTATVVVTDENLPDLVVQNIRAPSTAVSEEYVSLEYRIANQGIALAQGPWMQRVFLSRDPVVGDDILVGQYNFQGSMPAGLYFEQSVPARMPLESGKYWVVVVTDVGESVRETLEGNNATISQQPILVGPAYTAVVRADLKVALPNTPIPLSGSATRADGTPAKSVLINIHLQLRETKRVISALTDSNGGFSTQFKPLVGEGGNYQVWSGHPGTKPDTWQDEFAILGLEANPATLTLSLKEGANATGRIVLQNLTKLPLTSVTVVLREKPDTVDSTLSISQEVIPGLGVTDLLLHVTALNASKTKVEAVIQLNSAEGLSMDIPVSIFIEPLRPLLVVSPGSLLSGMKRGAQTITQFEVKNVGGLPSGPLSVLLPNVPWLSVPSGTSLSSLAPGESHQVTLLLSPAPDLPLGPYSGSIAINGSTTGVGIPFEFRAVSELKGDLSVLVTDEYTYYAEGAPKIQGANVLIRDVLTGSIVAEGLTDLEGGFAANGLPEAYYDVEVIAEKHNPYRGTHLLVPGTKTIVNAFLPRNVVQLSWTAVPTEIEDRTEITISTVFETYVPMPVVTLDPPVIDLRGKNLDFFQIDLKVSNHGLIAAEQGGLYFGEDPEYEILPLVRDIGLIPPNSSFTIPLTIRKKQALTGRGQARQSAPAGESPCIIEGGLRWSLVCGERKQYFVPTRILPDRFCESSVLVISPPPPPSNCIGCGLFQVVGPNLSSGSINLCQCPSWLEGSACVGGDVGLRIPGILSEFANWLSGVLPSGARLENIDAKISGGGELCVCCSKGSLGTSRKGEVKLEVTGEVLFGPPPLVALPPPLGWIIERADLEVKGAITVELAGQITISSAAECGEEGKTCISGEIGMKAFAGATAEASVKATLVTVGQTKKEYEGKISGRLGIEGFLGVKGQWCSGEEGKMQACATLSAVANLEGQLTAGNAEIKPLSLGGTISLIDWCKPSKPEKQTTRGFAGLASDSSTDPFDNAGFGPVDFFEDILSNQEVLTLPQISQFIPSSGGACAQVKLNIDQQSVISRDAFKATLEIANTSGSSLENISVEVVATDALGQDRNSFFGVRQPVLSNLSGVDGSGIVANGVTGIASWVLVPGSDAAPNGPTQYFVGGTLRYTQDGLLVTVPLAPAPITVYPNANLVIDYFHQRDVYGDDPFTPEIEASIPFSLGVMVQNTGNGEARNVRIVAGQPKIVENEKGVLVDFKIIATEVAGQNMTTTLTANFGTIPPDSIRIGRWLLTSTLQGLFIDYKATFEHLDGLGNPKLSLIQDVRIHEMIHMAQAGGRFEDGLPDFLVNDFPDLHDDPDTLYLSDGSVEPVSLVTEGVVSTAPSATLLQADLLTTMPPGWSYLRTPDPADGKYRLVRVVRSDGVEIAFDKNVWTTDRTFIGLGKRPIYENTIHLLDYDSTGSYTLYYEALKAPDLAAPASQVLPMATSTAGTQLAVQWTGDDGAGQGIAFFDVFVSTDNGPFLPWVTRSTQFGALYPGEPGRHYAFYSVATDYAGNREALPTSADAQTTVGAGNTAPVLNPIEDHTITEGQPLNIAVSGIDTDLVGNVLTYTLEPGAPIGVVLHPTTGALSWATGENHGGTVATIGVRATDNGIPSLSDVEIFTVTVLEQNTAPQLDPIPNVTLAPGQLLAFTAVASDADVPVQSRAFSLDAGAPATASIDPVSGQFSWTPTQAEVGTFVITVRVTDAGQPSLDDIAVFQVRVERPNTAPSIVGQPPLTAEPGKLYTFAFEVIDGEGDAFSIATPVKPAWLSLISTGTGTAKLEGTPTAADIGKHPVTLTVSDRQAANHQSFIIAVQSVIHPPRTLADRYTLAEDQVLEVKVPGVLENDTDEDNDRLTAELVDEPTHGTIEFREDGSFGYTPDENFHGDDSFTYRARDAEHSSEVTTVTLKIDPVPETPVITWPAPLAIVYGTPLSEVQLNAICDLPGAIAYNPPLGTMLHAGLGQKLTAQFIPDDPSEHSGAAAEVSIDVLKAPLTVTALDRTKLYGAPLPNFGYRIGMFVPPDTESVLTKPVAFNTAASQKSTVGLYEIMPVGAEAADYQITFVPGQLRIQPAPLKIWAEDKAKYYQQPNPPLTARYEGFQLGETASVLTSPALLSTSADENSAPGFYPIDVFGAAALNYAIDFMPGRLAVSLPPAPVIEFSKTQLTYEEDSGWVYLDNQASVQFEGAPRFEGWKLELQLTQATADDSLDLAPSALGPLRLGDGNDLLAGVDRVGRLVNDSGNPHSLVVEFTGAASLGLIEETLRSVVYQNGSQNPDTAARTFEAVLQTSFAPATAPSALEIQIFGVNDAPAVQGESATVDAGRMSAILLADLLANDSDPEGDTISILAAISPSGQGGTVQLTATHLSYTPAAGFVGTDHVEYVVSDAFGAETVGILTLTVRSANRPPVARPDTAGTLVNKPVAITAAKLLLNDIDPDGDALAVVAVSAATAKGGTASLADGTVTYVPPANFTGTDTFTYTVDDSAGTQASATVTVTIAASFALAPTSVTPQADGSVTVRFIGRARSKYIIQASDDGQNWVTLVTQSAAINGAFTYSDRTNPQPVNRTYRAISP